MATVGFDAVIQALRHDPPRSGYEVDKTVHDGEPATLEKAVRENGRVLTCPGFFEPVEA